MITRLNIQFDMSAIIEQVSLLQFSKCERLNETTGNLFSGNYLVKDQFKKTPLGNVLESLGNIGEARLLRLYSGETYTAHTDPDDRYHLAIETNPYSYLIDLTNNNMYHVPVDGSLWTMDTGVKHVAANFGGTSRVHLNIRHKLPSFTTLGYKVTFLGDVGIDWKQQLHIDLLGYLNYEIKKGIVTGIEKINERELLLNCSQVVIDDITTLAKSKGFHVIVIPV